MRRIEPHFRLSHGMPSIDDLRTIGSIIFVMRSCLRWRAAPKGCGPHMTIYIVSIAGAGWACSTVYSRRWQPRLASPTSL